MEDENMLPAASIPKAMYLIILECVLQKVSVAVMGMHALLWSTVNKQLKILHMWSLTAWLAVSWITELKHLHLWLYFLIRMTLCNCKGISFPNNVIMKSEWRRIYRLDSQPHLMHDFDSFSDSSLSLSLRSSVNLSS